MSSSIGLFRTNNHIQNIQNIVPIKSDIINYNNQVPNLIQIPHKNKSSSLLTVQEKKISPNLSSSISPNSITNGNLTTIIENPESIRIQKKIFKRGNDSIKPIQMFNPNSNLTTNFANFQKFQTNPNKINILDNVKKNLSLFDLKPIEENISSSTQIHSPNNKNNFINKIINPLTTRKIFDKNLNRNTNIHNNYFNCFNSSSNINLNNSVEFNNRKNNILLNSYKSVNDIKKTNFDNKLIHSISNFSCLNKNLNTNSLKQIPLRENNYYNKSIIINSNNFINTTEIKNNNFTNIKKHDFQININDYKINKNNDNNNNSQQNTINNKYNINNIYYINSNIIPIQYIIINKKINGDPDSNFNLYEFIKIKEIGKGTEGTIYSVKWIKNNKIYALKKTRMKTLDLVKKKQEEIRMIKEFRNKTGNNGIINIFADKCIKSQNGFYDFYEIMEFAQKDWEQEVYSRGYYRVFYKESEIMEIMATIVRTFSLLQKNHITHRDIKPQNIIIVNGEFKICDFGNSKLLKREGYCVQRIRGSEMFMSPIMFRALHSKMPQVKHNTYKSDVFSLGMCFLLVASLSYSPLNTIREIYDMNKIYNIIKYYLSNRYSQKVINILNAMLQMEENLRPDFIQLESMFPPIYFV